MARDKGDLSSILAAIVARLIDQVTEFNAANCYLSINPDSLPSGPGEITCVVAPTSGTFDQGMIEGGGDEQNTSDGGVIVKIHSPVQLDEADRDTVFLTDASLGLLSFAKQAMQALSGWSPDDGGGNETTRDPLHPAGYAFQRDGRKLGACELTFHLKFDWDLS